MLIQARQAKLQSLRIWIILIMLLIGSLAGEKVCQADSSENKWLKCDTSKATLIFGWLPADEVGIHSLVTHTDNAGTCHLFWILSDLKAKELWHAAWIKGSQMDKANGQFTKLASIKLGEIKFTVTDSSNGLAIAWTDTLKGFWGREWNTRLLEWKPRFDGPVMDDEACSELAGPPSYFPDENIIFWRSFCNVPIDADSFRPNESKDITAEEYSKISTKIMAAVHDTKERLYYARRNTKSNRGWFSPEVVLTEGKTLGASNNSQAVFKDYHGGYSVFCESSHEGLGEEIPVLCHFTFDSKCKSTPLLKNQWPLFTHYSNYQVWPVVGTAEYFIVWDGPEEPKERFRTLFYSTTATPWLPNILTPYRGWGGGMDSTVPCCIFKKDGNKGVCGLAAWASEVMPCAIAISRYQQNGWSPTQVVMTRNFHSEFTIGLRTNSEGVLYVTTNSEIRAIPFRVMWN